MNIIFKTIFGSHLYGTNTENSDSDYKGVFLPSKEQIFLGKIPKSLSESTKKGDVKNSISDVDTEIYSLHYFIHLACEGETVALDMLYAPENMWVESSDIWRELISLRYKFYTKNLKAFIGYARKQASKYGIKGSRLNDAKRILDYLDLFASQFIPLSEIWDDLPIGEHIIKHDKSPETNNERMYEVCGRKINERAKAIYAYNIIKKFYDNYGERAKQAADNKGIDWKAVSHAFRAAYQVKQILTENIIIFPLKEVDYLKKIKAGELHYQNEVAPTLDNLMDEVENLSVKSHLPQYCDRKFWDHWLINIIDNSI